MAGVDAGEACGLYDRALSVPHMVCVHAWLSAARCFHNFRSGI